MGEGGGLSVSSRVRWVRLGSDQYGGVVGGVGLLGALFAFHSTMDNFICSEGSHFSLTKRESRMKMAVRVLVLWYVNEARPDIGLEI